MGVRCYSQRRCDCMRFPSFLFPCSQRQSARVNSMPFSTMESIAEVCMNRFPPQPIINELHVSVRVTFDCALGTSYRTAAERKSRLLLWATPEADPLAGGLPTRTARPTTGCRAALPPTAIPTTGRPTVAWDSTMRRSGQLSWSSTPSGRTLRPALSASAR